MLLKRVNDIKKALSRFSGVKVNLGDWENGMFEMSLVLQRKTIISVYHR